MNSSTQKEPSGAEATNHSEIQEIDQLILLNDEYTVSKTFFDCVQLQVEETLPRLASDKRYTSKRLCSKEFWKQMDNGERRMAGRCIAHSVVLGLLPLSFVEGAHEYPKYYQLK